MKGLPCEELHWNEVARHEGQAMFLLGERRKAKGDHAGARKAYSDGLRKFKGWELDPEAKRVRARLEQAAAATR